MTALSVRLNDTQVGALEYFEEDEEYLFTFDEAWLRNPDRPVLGQLFEDRRPHPMQFSGPPCWFSHLMPQGPLRRAIAHAFRIEEYEEFSLYEFLGDDLPGAVLLTPIAGSPARRPIRQVFHESPKTPFRFSLAGMQLKMSVRREDKRLTLPLDHARGNVIAKVHSQEFKDLPRIEFATMTWAAAAGVRTPHFQLDRAESIDGLPAELPLGDGTVYLIDRFDRTKESDRRIHFEDFAQVLDRPLDRIYQAEGQKTRYETVAAVLSHLYRDDVKEFVERLVFCALAGNGDAHLKNWAIVYPDGRHARLAPAYDLVSTILYPSRLVSDELALSLNDSQRFEDVELSSFDILARECSCAAETVRGWVRQMAGRTIAAWSNSDIRGGYTNDEIETIERHLSRVPLVGVS